MHYKELRNGILKHSPSYAMLSCTADYFDNMIDSVPNAGLYMASEDVCLNLKKSSFHKADSLGFFKSVNV
jgi:hypothetical protein